MQASLSFVHVNATLACRCVVLILCVPSLAVFVSPFTMLAVSWGNVSLPPCGFPPLPPSFFVFSCTVHVHDALLSPPSLPHSPLFLLSSSFLLAIVRLNIMGVFCSSICRGECCAEGVLASRGVVCERAVKGH